MPRATEIGILASKNHDDGFFCGCFDFRFYRRIFQLSLFVLTTALILNLTGCGRHSEITNDPELEARLAGLTQELHHAMIGRKLNRNFDEFVALTKLDVPAPPPGKKYAISKDWNVILVENKL